MCLCCLWAHLGPPKPTHVCNVLAIWGLRDDFFNYFTIFSQDFVNMCFPLLWEAHFWKAAQSILHHFTPKNSCFGPLSDTKMRHFGHFRPPWNLKKRRKNVYYLFMSPLGPPKAHTCMHHTCDFRLARPFLMIFIDLWWFFDDLFTICFMIVWWFFIDVFNDFRWVLI